MDEKKTYTQQEVTEILKRALRQERLGEKNLTHQDLVAMAAEIGIDRNALDAATTELAQRQTQELARRTEAEELAAERSRQLARLTTSAITFLAVGGLVFVLGKYLQLGDWYYGLLLVWGALVALRIRHVISPHDALAKRKLKESRRLAREERRAKREAWRRDWGQRLRGNYGAQSMNESTREFENAVQAGVSALLSVAARKIQEHAERTTKR